MRPVTSPTKILFGLGQMRYKCLIKTGKIIKVKHLDKIILIIYSKTRRSKNCTVLSTNDVTDFQKQSAPFAISKLSQIIYNNIRFASPKFLDVIRTLQSIIYNITYILLTLTIYHFSYV